MKTRLAAAAALLSRTGVRVGLIAVAVIATGLVTSIHFVGRDDVKSEPLQSSANKQKSEVKSAMTTAEPKAQAAPQTSNNSDPASDDSAAPKPSGMTSKATTPASPAPQPASTPTTKTPTGTKPPMYAPPQPTGPASITAISLTPTSSGCMYGNKYTAYRYDMDLRPGYAVKPQLAWETAFTDPAQSGYVTGGPLYPLYDNPLPASAYKISDTVPLHYGFQAMTYADYRIRLRSDTVVSNWVVVPRSTECR